MIANVIVAAILGTLLAGAIWRLPAFHPAQLWLLPWALATTLFALELLPYRPLSSTTSALVVGASVAFVAGTLAGERTRWYPYNPRDRTDRDSSRIGTAFLIALLILAAALLTGFLWQMASRYGLSSVVFTSPDVRAAVAAGETSLTIKYIYIVFAVLPLAAMRAASFANDRRGIFAATSVALIGSLYFSTGRSTVASGIIVATVAYSIERYGRPSRRVFAAFLGISGVLALVVFTVGGRIIGKTFENNSELRSVPSVFVSHTAARDFALPYQYATAPLAAFDIIVGEARPFGATRGCAMLPEVCGVLTRLGIDVPNARRIRPFTARPLPWNTYTGLDAPLLDGGYIFAIPIIGVIGFIIGVVWRQVERGSHVARVGYALAAPALLSSPGSFTFTAPHLVGAFALAAICVEVAPRLMEKICRREPRFLRD